MSDGNEYIDNIANADLRMNLDDHVPKRIGQRRDVRLKVPDVESGNLPLHPLLVNDLRRADELWMAEFTQTSVVPPVTTNWEL